MKKILIFLLFLSLFTFNANAEPKGKDSDLKYGMAGCGVGSLFISDKGKPMQLLAVTTNGTGVSQWIGVFAITSGTSNCTEDGI